MDPSRIVAPPRRGFPVGDPDPEARAAEILGRVRRARQPLPRWVWAVAIAVSGVCVTGLAIAWIEERGARPTKLAAAAAAQPASGGGGGIGLGIGLVVGIALGLAVGIALGLRRGRGQRSRG